MKVLYFTRSLAHQRALESFKPRDKMEQLILAPEPNITSNLVPEDYRAFRISVKTYKNISQAQSIANQFKPGLCLSHSLNMVAYHSVAYINTFTFFC